MYKDPDGKLIFEGNGQTTFNSMLGGGISEQDAAKMTARIEELEERLGKYEVKRNMLPLQLYYHALQVSLTTNPKP